MVAQRITIWHESDKSLMRLRMAIDHNCGCGCEPHNYQSPAHAMLNDQKALDHLAFVWSRRRAFIAAEYREQIGG